jgi:hypothetical protein
VPESEGTGGVKRTRPAQRDVESCVGFLVWLITRSQDPEHRDEKLNAREIRQLDRHMGTAIFTVEEDTDECDAIREIQGWIMTEPEKLSFRNVARNAGPLVQELVVILKWEYGEPNALPARRVSPQSALTIRVDPPQKRGRKRRSSSDIPRSEVL